MINLKTVIQKHPVRGKLKYDIRTHNYFKHRATSITDSWFSVVPDEEIYRYSLVQYYFKGEKEHPIEHNQHGNSKRSQTEYVRTWESTKDLLEKASPGKAPRETVSHAVNKDLGGITSCIGVGQLPRSRQQSSDLKQIETTG